MESSVKNLRPVFTGRTDEGEEITLFQHINKPMEIHILLPNGELFVLSPSAEVNTWYDQSTYEMRVDVNSPEWTGMARGNRWELLRVDPR